MVAKWMAFWTKYRAILTQDIIHVKRPDMQSIDALMHVTANMSAPVAALAMLYNPTLATQTAKLELPLYYSGEGDEVLIAREEGAFEAVSLARDYSVGVNVTLPPRGITYFVVKRTDGTDELKK